MAYDPAPLEHNLGPAPEINVAEVVVLPTPLIERIGRLAIIHSESSVRHPFETGAVGHTDAQVHIRGQIACGVAGRINLILPEKPGNVLVIPQEALIDTSLELMRHWSSSVKFNGEHLLRGLVRALAGREFGGVRYDAAVSYFANPVKRLDEITFATPYSEDLVMVHSPWLK